MITIAVSIDGNPIYVRTAVNTSPPEALGTENNHYLLDTGKFLKHKPTEGVIVLAKKMLDTVVEVGAKPSQQ